MTHKIPIVNISEDLKVIKRHCLCVFIADLTYTTFESTRERGKILSIVRISAGKSDDFFFRNFLPGEVFLDKIHNFLNKIFKKT